VADDLLRRASRGQLYGNPGPGTLKIDMDFEFGISGGRPARGYGD